MRSTDTSKVLDEMRATIDAFLIAGKWDLTPQELIATAKNLEFPQWLEEMHLTESDETIAVWNSCLVLAD